MTKNLKATFSRINYETQNLAQSYSSGLKILVQDFNVHPCKKNGPLQVQGLAVCTRRIFFCDSTAISRQNAGNWTFYTCKMQGQELRLVCQECRKWHIFNVDFKNFQGETPRTPLAGRGYAPSRTYPRAGLWPACQPPAGPGLSCNP